VIGVAETVKTAADVVDAVASRVKGRKATAPARRRRG
jgi:hypothetical protein